MNRVAFIAIAALAALSLPVSAQAPDTSWTRVIGGSDFLSFATDIKVDRAGYIYVCGQAQRPGGTDEDLVVARLNEWGDTVWVRYLDGTSVGSEDIAHALALDELGNVYVAGALDNAAPHYRDMVVAKFSPAGDPLWTWVSELDDDDIAYGLAVGNNQVYACGVIAGDGYGAFTVARLNAQTGALVWMRDTVLDPFLDRAARPRRPLRIARHPGWYTEWTDWDNAATAIAISPNDGTVVATGYGFHDTRDYQMWTMKYDSLGIRHWSRHNGRTTQDYDDVAFDLAIARNGDVYITGLGEADAPGYDWLTIRMTSGGAFLNSATLNAAYNGDDWATAICLDSAVPAQNVYVTGFLNYGPAHGDERIVTMKYSPELATRWGGAGAQYQSHSGAHPDVGYDVHYTQGHVFVTGRSGENGNELVLLCYTEANASPKYEKWARTVTLEGPTGSTIGSAVYARDTNRVYVAGQQGLEPGLDRGVREMVVLRFSDQFRDVGPDSLLAPVGTVGFGSRVVPRVRVRNLGDTRASFEVRLRIGVDPAYYDTAFVGNLLPGATGFAVFDTWTAGPADTLPVLVTTALVGDDNPANDTLRGTVVVSDRDVGVVEIIAPVGVIDSGAVVAPVAVVRNYGRETVAFPILFTVGSDYADSARVSLGSGQTDTFSFRDWTATRVGRFEVVCWTRLTGDLNPANDTLRDSVEVIPWTGIEEPGRLPAGFALESIRPTPFRGGTVLGYALPAAAEIELTVHDAAGRLVRTLARGRFPAGRHTAAWDGRDDTGRELGAGVYVCRLATGETIRLRKLVKLD